MPKEFQEYRAAIHGGTYIHKYEHKHEHKYVLTYFLVFLVGDKSLRDCERLRHLGDPVRPHSEGVSSPGLHSADQGGSASRPPGLPHDAGEELQVSAAGRSPFVYTYLHTSVQIIRSYLPRKHTYIHIYIHDH